MLSIPLASGTGIILGWRAQSSAIALVNFKHSSLGAREAKNVTESIRSNPLSSNHRHVNKAALLSSCMSTWCLHIHFERAGQGLSVVRAATCAVTKAPYDEKPTWVSPRFLKGSDGSGRNLDLQQLPSRLPTRATPSPISPWQPHKSPYSLSQGPMRPPVNGWRKWKIDFRFVFSGK